MPVLPSFACSVAALKGRGGARVGLTALNGLLAGLAIVAALNASAGVEPLVFVGGATYLAATIGLMWTPAANRFFAAHRRQRASS